MNSEGYFLVKKGNAQEAFELRNFELKAPLIDELVIEVEAFGLNYADVMARQGLYREAPAFPCIVGYEVVGKVVGCGNVADKHWLGKRVVAFTRFGAYAKHAITKNYAVVAIGDLNAGKALALATQYVTAYYMVHRAANVHPGERVLIHAAAGGVGIALIQLLKLRGAEIYAKVSSDSKMNLVKSLGADFAVNYKKADYKEQIQDLLKSNRLDVSFNPVAGSTFKKDWHLLGTGGRLVLFGGSELSNGKWGLLSTLNFVRKMGVVIPIGLMMRSKTMIGVNMLKVADFKPQVLTQCLNEVVTMLAEGVIDPVVGGVYAHHELPKAHEALEQGNTTGKLIVTWHES